jgi:phage shock protein C
VSRLQHQTSGDLSRKFHIDTGNGKFLGVCAGLARYFGVDPTIVRVAFVIGALCSVGTFILIYFAIALLAD